eukprot:scaffold132412_cov26-Tisochrysis_lutea.AAC.9
MPASHLAKRASPTPLAHVHHSMPHRARAKAPPALSHARSVAVSATYLWQGRPTVRLVDVLRGGGIRIACARVAHEQQEAHEEFLRRVRLAGCEWPASKLVARQLYRALERPRGEAPAATLVQRIGRGQVAAKRDGLQLLHLHQRLSSDKCELEHMCRANRTISPQRRRGRACGARSGERVGKCSDGDG